MTEATPAETLFLNITYRCNSRCQFCAADIAYDLAPQPISLKAVQNLIGSAHYRAIYLSGGEPTLHPEIEGIIALSRVHSEGVILLTHGRRLKDPAFAEGLVRSGVTFLIIPLYGPDARSHDRVTQVKGSFDQTIAGFESLKELRLRYPFRVELKLLLSRYTAPLNQAIYRFAVKGHGAAIDQVSICPLIYSRSTLEFEGDYVAPFESLKPFFFPLIEEIHADHVWGLRLNEFPPCFFPSERLRRMAHPRLETRQQIIRSYGESGSHERSVLRGGADSYTAGVGNGKVQSCQRCVLREYCAQLNSPVYSQAYLDLFGERDFHPIRQQEVSPWTFSTSTLTSVR